MKQNLKCNEFVILCDFAENYSFVVQDEIQAYHWVNAQCTVHPFVIYYLDGNNKLQNISLIILAESLEHNITSVKLFQDKLLQFLKQKFHKIDKISFFSDGAASQYKNKKNFVNLCEMQIEHKIKVEWNFFATYHGKSPCDGLGGTFKRLASRASLQRPYRDQLLTVKDLFEWVKQQDYNFTTVLCLQREHDAMARHLKNKYNNVKTVPGTRDFHYISPVNKNTIIAKRFSSEEAEAVRFQLY